MFQAQPLIKPLGGNGGSISRLSYGTVPPKDLEAGNSNKYDYEFEPLLANSKTAGQRGRTSTASRENDDARVAEAVFVLLWMGQRRYPSSDLGKHPKTNPKLPPEARYKRHRNYSIFKLNQFRHWWKTSRCVRSALLLAVGSLPSPLYKRLVPQ
jgi:hypothetical protein